MRGYILYIYVRQEVVIQKEQIGLLKYDIRCAVIYLYAKKKRI